MNVLEINILVLAYLGDTIYEDYIRKYLINLGINNVDELQTKSLDFVSAKSQAMYFDKMIDDNFFYSDELDIIKRARNYKNSRHPKNCDLATYKKATSLEALIGYLEYTNNHMRIEQIMNYILR